MLRIALVLALVLTLATWTAGANAGLVCDVTATTDMGTWFTYDIADLTNGSGLSYVGFGATHSSDYMDMWMSDGILTGTVTFDLGALYTLTGIGIWNYNHRPNVWCCLGRGVQNMNVFTSQDGSTYAFLSSVTLPIGTGSPIPAHVVSVAGVHARYVLFDILSNHGNPVYTGLSEVQFDVMEQPSAAEPTTWGQIKKMFKD